MNEGLGGTGGAAVAALVRLQLLRLLELHNVAFRIPPIECGVSAEVPSSGVRLEVAACCFHCAANFREACNDERRLERGFLSRLGRLLDGDSGCVLSGNRMDDYLVPMSSEEIVRGVRLLDCEAQSLLIEGRDALLVLGKDNETLLQHEWLSVL